jgi:hypothetical protein
MFRRNTYGPYISCECCTIVRVWGRATLQPRHREPLLTISIINRTRRNAKMNFFLQLLVVAAVVLAVAAFSPSPSSARANMHSALSMLKVGDVAPDFTLSNFAGKSFKLSSFKGKKPVVVFFYPNDNSPGCTKEVRRGWE